MEFILCFARRMELFNSIAQENLHLAVYEVISPTQAPSLTVCFLSFLEWTLKKLFL